MMTQTSTVDLNARKARTLLQQGYIAYNNWEIQKARLLWRKAAVVDPANEEIWLALLNVTQDDEDRKVCLQNILILNPTNEDAEKRLRLLENETQPAEIQPLDENPIDSTIPDIGEGLKLAFSWILSAVLIVIVSVILLAMLIQPFI